MSDFVGKEIKKWQTLMLLDGFLTARLVNENGDEIGDAKLIRVKFNKATSKLSLNGDVDFGVAGGTKIRGIRVRSHDHTVVLDAKENKNIASMTLYTLTDLEVQL